MEYELTVRSSTSSRNGPRKSMLLVYDSQLWADQAALELRRSGFFVDERAVAEDNTVPTKVVALARDFFGSAQPLRGD